MSEAASPPPGADEVNLGAIPDRTLVRVLRRRGYRVEDEDECDEEGNLVDGAMISRAGAYFRRGDVVEALFLLERALPDAFAGLSTAAVPASSR